MGSIYKRDGRWGIDYRDHQGRRIRKVVATDKDVALRLLGEALDAAEKMKAGILAHDPREGVRPVAEHVRTYLEDLQRRGRDAMYVYIVKKRLEAMVFAQEWACLKDITPRSISAYLRDLAGEGKSPRTVNQHRSDLSAFLAWCEDEGFIAANPCQRVKKTAVKEDKKRRALTEGECRDLLGAAPVDRRVCYLTLVYTGLRRSEAAELKWGHVHLDGVNPYIELPASLTKSGKPEEVPLLPEVARALRPRRSRPGEPVFASVPSMVQFRKDLAQAGIEEVDARGRRVVLHSLRHSLATMLAQSKVPPAIAMKIMRHRDIKLTLETYTDEGLLSAAAAMASLPSLLGSATA